MTTFDPTTVTLEQLYAPGVTPEYLAQVAQVRPDLWTAILSHPACYPGLADWINAQLRAQTQAQPQQPVSPDPLDQVTEGAKKLASGAKDFFTEQVAPRAAKLAQDTQQLVNDQAAKLPGREPTYQWILYGMIISAFVGIIDLFLPIVKFWGMSISLMGGREIGIGSDGIIFLIAYILVGGLVGVFLATNKSWAAWAGSILGIVVGVIALIDGFRIVGLAKDPLSPGIGVWVLILVGLALTAMSVLSVLYTNREHKRKVAAAPYAPPFPTSGVPQYGQPQQPQAPYGTAPYGQPAYGQAAPFQPQAQPQPNSAPQQMPQNESEPPQTPPTDGPAQP
ncbi:hypothetical protein I6E29_03900 [Arcanobacterium haemolyticum]|nr:hypothetical protein [Arcanobacterium haemolyticum]